MRRGQRIAQWLFAGGLATGLAGCGLFGPAHDEPSTMAAASVDMGFASFDPPTVAIHAGQTIEFRNTSIVTHTVTDDPNLAAMPSDVALPPGAAPFDSGDIPAGEVYTRVFTAPGTYRYFCRHHEEDGMVATIVVDVGS